MTTRATGRRDGKEASEELLNLLRQGNELLGAGKVIEAKDYLERAYQLQPQNEKAQNLLGLAYFKLGLFDRAGELYELLVRENPVDPTLRVNLGLVYFKTNVVQRAIRELEAATDLAPEHKKAQNYLGLALAQAGEYARARERFLLAGSDAMAEKMSHALAGENVDRPGAAPGKGPGSGAEAREGVIAAAHHDEEAVLGAREEEGEGEIESAGAPVVVAARRKEEPPAAPERVVEQLKEQDWGAQFGMEGQGAPGVGGAGGRSLERREEAARPPGLVARKADWGGFEAPSSAGPTIEVVLDTAEAQMAAAQGEGAYAEAGAEGGAVGEPQAHGGGMPVAPLAALAPALQLFPEQSAEPFQIRADSVAINVRGEMLTRLSGLIAQSGRLELQPELKRFRGRLSDKPFGEGDARMVRATGSGALIVQTERQVFVAIELGDESGYFREDCVFAFEEPVMFENGRVPSEVAPDLDLVHLRGKGMVLLRLPGSLSSLEVRFDRPVTVPLPHLVGWHGDLTPRIVALTTDAQGKPIRVGAELSGQGFALLALSMG